jgi:hypothetical protein
MENDEHFIRQNARVILSHPKVLAETERFGGGWSLQEIPHSFSRRRYIEFGFLLVNESGQSILGSAKIDRESCKVSNVEIGER